MSQLIKDVPVRSNSNEFWEKFEISLECIRRGRQRDFQFQMKQQNTFLLYHKVLYWFVMWDIKHGPIDVWS